MSQHSGNAEQDVERYASEFYRSQYLELAVKTGRTDALGTYLKNIGFDATYFGRVLYKLSAKQDLLSDALKPSFSKLSFSEKEWMAEEVYKVLSEKKMLLDRAFVSTLIGFWEEMRADLIKARDTSERYNYCLFMVLYELGEMMYLSNIDNAEEYLIEAKKVSTDNFTKYPNRIGKVLHGIELTEEEKKRGYDALDVPESSDIMFGFHGEIEDMELEQSWSDIVRIINPYLFSYWDSNLCLLKTPKKNSCSIDLPATMYDSSGKSYSKMPILSKSITLTRKGGKFTDVKDPTHPYYRAIYWAAGVGITKGYSDGTFGFDKSCTRGEMMMFLWRFAGKPTPKTVSKSPFKDVSEDHTFYKAILCGAQNGITKGYSDGTFGINRNVTRGACMMFLWRLKGQPNATTVSKSPFRDVPKTHAYYKAILWGAQKKITTGYTSGARKGTFGINENCTRGQIVTFLYRAK